MSDEDKRKLKVTLPNPVKVFKKIVTVPLKILEKPEVQLCIEIEEEKEQ